MKATITIDRILEIQTVTELEGYALRKWVEENIDRCNNVCKAKSITFDIN